MQKRIFKAVSGSILALSTAVVFAGTMGPVATPNYIYAGAFGGGGGLMSGDTVQYGTAFFVEAAGGPLAVNSFGRYDSTSAGMVGGHVGMAWNDMGTLWPFTPAVELEGYYMGWTDIDGEAVNESERLREHDFHNTFPQKTGVFLVNALFNANNPVFGNIKPYVGIGFGTAVISVTGAFSEQQLPPEPGVNHFSANPDSMTLVFATQPKVGLRYDLGFGSIFGEYRFLYLSQSNHTFGSTIAAGHAPTSPWQVAIKSQYYNMGTVGIDFYA